MFFNQTHDYLFSDHRESGHLDTGWNLNKELTNYFAHFMTEAEE